MSHSHGGGRRSNAMLADKERARSSKELLVKLVKYLNSVKKELITVAILILVFTAAQTIQPLAIQNVLNQSLSQSPNLSTIYVLIVVFAITSLAIWLFQSLNSWVMAGIQAKLVDNVRKDTFSKLLQADMSYHHQNQSGNITSRVVSDTQELANGLQVFATLMTQLLSIITIFAILIAINIGFTLISLIAIPVAFGVTKFFSTVGKSRMLQVRQAYGNVSGKLAENLAGVSIAKAFNQEGRTSKEIAKLNQKSYEYMKQLGTVFILVFPTVSFVQTLIIYGVLVWGGYATTFSAIEIGTIYLGTILVQRFMVPMMHLSQYFTQLQASLAALDRVIDIIEAEPRVTDLSNATPLTLKTAEIKFEDVTFAYTNTAVLKQLSFTIPGGKKTALVGHTGAGKTTITSLLMRFYDPQHGNIYIDEQNLRSIQMKSLLSQISLVSQEPYLFADTVLENIRYGKPEATDKEIYELCETLGANEFIDALPDGYNTILQESGKSLSSGQRQMITIARTMLSDPAILILDEATSRLDAYSESLVQQAQLKLFEGRTTLVIAHRLSTIRDVDQIIVLEEGRLVEIGSHDELMKNKAEYSELYSMYYAHQGVEAIPLIKE